jgi:hypothetical protein
MFQFSQNVHDLDAKNIVISNRVSGTDSPSIYDFQFGPSSRVLYITQPLWITLRNVSLGFPLEDLDKFLFNSYKYKLTRMDTLSVEAFMNVQKVLLKGMIGNMGLDISDTRFSIADNVTIVDKDLTRIEPVSDLLYFSEWDIVIRPVYRSCPPPDASTLAWEIIFAKSRTGSMKENLVRDACVQTDDVPNENYPSCICAEFVHVDDDGSSP